jgi:HPt (histidine-containing phosphotransfer) domain-containing protein
MVATNPGEPAGKSGAVDLASALERLGGDLDFYEELLGLFRVDAQVMIEQVTQLVASGRRDEGRQVLHKLKGLAATMGACALVDAAQEAESAMAHGPATGEDRLVANTRNAFEQVSFAIAQGIAELRGSAAAGNGRTRIDE